MKPLLPILPAAAFLVLLVSCSADGCGAKAAPTGASAAKKRASKSATPSPSGEAGDIGPALDEAGCLALVEKYFTLAKKNRVPGFDVRMLEHCTDDSGASDMRIQHCLSSATDKAEMEGCLPEA